MIVGAVAIRMPVPVIIMRMTMMVVMVVRMRVAAAQHRKSLHPLAGKKVRPSPATSAKLPVSKSFAVSVIAMLVMLSRAAISPTMPTATSACTKAARKAITTPRRILCSFADEIGGDDHLAVARSGRMHDAVGEGDAAEPPEHRSVRLQSLQRGGELAIERRLQCPICAMKPPAGGRGAASAACAAGASGAGAAACGEAGSAGPGRAEPARQAAPEAPSGRLRPHRRRPAPSSAPPPPHCAARAVRRPRRRRSGHRN